MYIFPPLSRAKSEKFRPPNPVQLADDYTGVVLDTEECKRIAATLG